MLSAEAQSQQSPFNPHWALYPRSYVAQRTSVPLIDHIDGNLDKEVWSKIPWSELFDDIRGEADAPEDERPKSSCRTRFKALWDDDHIYIGAILESDFTTEAHFTQRNSPIYHTDSDFEVFMDPLGECQYYKEFEMNAINTVWNLMLDKPYADNGQEHSGRIAKPGDENYYEVFNQKTAAKVIKGNLNDPGAGAMWTVEIAMSYKDLLAHVPTSSKSPSVGSMWRINFSRVEKKGKINWTWQPQIAWDAHMRRFKGYVDMHRPDAWGYIVFGSEESDVDGLAVKRDLSWPSRLAAMNVYYAQRAFHETHGSYTSKMVDLAQFLDFAIIDPFDIEIKEGPASSSNEYQAVVSGYGYVVSVTQDRHLHVEKKGDDGGPSSVG